MLLILITTSCSLPLIIKADTKPKDNSAVAKSAYPLVTPPKSPATTASINKQIKDDEALAAMLIEQALYRLDSILGRILGKNNKKYITFKELSTNLMKSLDQFIPAAIPSNVTLAAQWANGSIDKKAGTFYMRNMETDAAISKQEKKHEWTSWEPLKILITKELKDFDGRYKPVVNVLKILKKQPTLFFDSLTALDVLYVNALK